MPAIATDVARSVVCVSVCVGHVREPCKTLDRSICRLGGLTLDWFKEPCIRWL